MNIKTILLVTISILATNAVTYNLAYQQAEHDTFLANVAVDIMRLKMYNDTGVCDDTITLNIEGLYIEAANSDNMDKFSSICKVFKKKYFDLVDDLLEKNSLIILNEELHGEIELGKKKIKKLCNISD
ncbi:MAG: hypothetical protein U9R27_01700 [Campylobacterota bacterium]|nr:hypothetical protein [Campylobacterota bacterium]